MLLGILDLNGSTFQMGKKFQEESFEYTSYYDSIRDIT